MATPSQSPKALGRYELACELSQSYLGSFWAVRVTSGEGQGLDAAARCIIPGQMADQLVFDRLCEAAWTAMEIASRRVPTVVDVVLQGSEIGVVSDYCEGLGLRALCRQATLKRTVMPAGVGVRLATDVLEALVDVHGHAENLGELDAGLYGGITPDSVLVGVDGEAHLLDVLVSGVAATLVSFRNHPERASYLTPEQVRETPVDARTDVFSVGVLLWEALAGRRLFFGIGGSVAQKILCQPIPSLDEIERPGAAALPKELCAVVDRALDRTPGNRFAGARDMLDAIQAAGIPIAERRNVADFLEQVGEHELGRLRRGLDRPPRGEPLSARFRSSRPPAREDGIYRPLSSMVPAIKRTGRSTTDLSATRPAEPPAGQPRAPSAPDSGPDQIASPARPAPPPPAAARAAEPAPPAGAAPVGRATTGARPPTVPSRTAPRPGAPKHQAVARPIGARPPPKAPSLASRDVPAKPAPSEPDAATVQIARGPAAPAPAGPAPKVHPPTEEARSAQSPAGSAVKPAPREPEQPAVTGEPRRAAPRPGSQPELSRALKNLADLDSAFDDESALLESLPPSTDAVKPASPSAEDAAPTAPTEREKLETAEVFDSLPPPPPGEPVPSEPAPAEPVEGSTGSDSDWPRSPEPLEDEPTTLWLPKSSDSDQKGPAPASPVTVRGGHTLGYESRAAPGQDQFRQKPILGLSPVKIPGGEAPSHRPTLLGVPPPAPGAVVPPRSAADTASAARRQHPSPSPPLAAPPEAAGGHADPDHKAAAEPTGPSRVDRISTPRPRSGASPAAVGSDALPRTPESPLPQRDSGSGPAEAGENRASIAVLLEDELRVNLPPPDTSLASIGRGASGSPSLAPPLIHDPRLADMSHKAPRAKAQFRRGLLLGVALALAAAMVAAALVVVVLRAPSPAPTVQSSPERQPQAPAASSAEPAPAPSSIPVAASAAPSSAAPSSTASSFTGVPEPAPAAPPAAERPAPPAPVSRPAAPAKPRAKRRPNYVPDDI